MKNLIKDMSKVHSSDNLTKQCIMGPISSVSADGKKVNVQTFQGSESRDNNNMTPYGVSSGPKRGMLAEVVTNGNDNNAVVGIYDKKKPKAAPGELILYAAGGQMIDLKPDGSIVITGVGPISINGTIAMTGQVTINGKTM